MLTRLPSQFFCILLCLLLCSCVTNRIQAPVPQQQTEVAQTVERYIQYSLMPAKSAPPTLQIVGEQQEGPLKGEATLVFAEEQSWNQWPDGSSRLFNNRAALLFQIAIHTEEPLVWRWDLSTLELNHEGNTVLPSPSAEPLLQDLLFWAFHQEKQLLQGDLINRSRGSGALRSAYLHTPVLHEPIEGLIAFPLYSSKNSVLQDLADPSTYHIVSMRLTCVFERSGELQTIVWTFD